MDHQAQTRKQAMLVSWILWGAMLVALAVYVFIIPVMQQGRTPPDNLDGVLPRNLGVVAAGIAALSFVLRCFLLGGFRSGELSGDTPKAAQRLVAGNIVCFALSESVGIFGVVLGAMGYPLNTCANFLMGAVLLLVYHMPLARRFEPEA